MLGQWASPACVLIDSHPQILFPGGDGWLYSLHPTTGRLVWKVDCNPPTATPWTPERRGTRNFFVSVPTVSQETVYIGVNQDLESKANSPRPVYAIDARLATKYATDSIKWKFDIRDFDGTLGAIAVKDDVVYTVSDSGTIFALNRLSGQEHWRAHLGERAYLFSAPYVNAGNVYVGTQSEMFIYAAGKEKKYINRYDFGGVLQNAPVVCDGVLIVATGGYLCAVPERKR